MEPDRVDGNCPCCVRGTIPHGGIVHLCEVCMWYASHLASCWHMVASYNRRSSSTRKTSSSQR